MSGDLWIYAGKAQTTDAKDTEPVALHRQYYLMTANTSKLETTK